MNIKNYVVSASITLSIAIIIIAYFLIPYSLWNPASILAFLIFTFLSGYGVYSIVDGFGGENGDASVIALSVPSGIIHFILLLVSIATLIVSFQNDSDLAWSLNIGTIAGIIISYLFFRVSASIVDNVVSNDDRRTKLVKWQSKVNMVKNITNDENVKNQLEIIEEKIKFSGTNIKNISSEYDLKIDICLHELESFIQNNEQLAYKGIGEILEKLKLNIDLRNIEIRK